MVAPFHQMSCRPEVAGTSMSISRLLGLCWLVMLFAGSRCAAQPTGSDFGALRSGEVVVWISTTLLNPGDFRTSFPQDFPNAKLLVREVAPETFVSEVERPQTVPPDVAFIDNYQQLGPLIRTNSTWRSRRPLSVGLPGRQDGRARWTTRSRRTRLRSCKRRPFPRCTPSWTATGRRWKPCWTQMRREAAPARWRRLPADRFTRRSIMLR